MKPNKNAHLVLVNRLLTLWLVCVALAVIFGGACSHVDQLARKTWTFDKQRYLDDRLMIIRRVNPTESIEGISASHFVNLVRHWASRSVVDSLWNSDEFQIKNSRPIFTWEMTHPWSPYMLSGMFATDTGGLLLVARASRDDQYIVESKEISSQTLHLLSCEFERLVAELPITTLLGKPTTDASMEILVITTPVGTTGGIGCSLFADRERFAGLINLIHTVFDPLQESLRERRKRTQQEDSL